MIDVLKHQVRRGGKTKPQDPDRRAEKAAKHQRKARVAQVREHELSHDYDERPSVRVSGGWPFQLGNFAGF